jgi:hypothetical protein
MATARLIDSQKQELVQRFRQGESTQALADHFGCSPTTVTRLVRSEMDPQEYAALRDQRQRRGARDGQIPLAVAGSPAQESLEQESGGLASVPAEAASLQEPLADADSAEDPTSPSDNDDEVEGAADDVVLEPTAGTTTVLAIDDADDFGEDEESEEDDLLSSDEEGDDRARADAGDFHTVAVLQISVDDQQETRPAPWSPALLPSCAYLLVDKTVELQARPLAEMPELGRLPSEEQERQALVLFTNPRQAKRHCGRTQRVIKLPDPALLGRTAPYLLAQGISRVVIEGALYALPEHP